MSIPYEYLDLKILFYHKGAYDRIDLNGRRYRYCVLIKCFKLFWIKMIKIYQCSKENVYYKWKNTKKYNI